LIKNCVTLTKKCDAAWHHHAICHKIQRSCRHAKWHQHAVRMKTAAACDQRQAATPCDRQRFLSSRDFRASWQRYALPFECLSFGLILFSNRQGSAVAETARRLTHTSRVPCTKVLSKKIQIFQETSFCVLQVSLLDFTNTI